MKTSRIFPIWILILCMTSCSTYHVINTRINRDGSMTRGLSTVGDSAFMNGDNSHSPFLYILNDEWAITRYDTVTAFEFMNDKVKFNVRAERTFASPAAFSRKMQAKENLKALAVPREELKKQFCWFYTYYTYSAVYKNLSDSLPISLNLFLSDAEQRVLFQGEMSALKGMNGMERYEVLDGMSAKFENWFKRCEFEITYDAIIIELRNNTKTSYNDRLADVRDSVYNSIKFDAQEADHLTCEKVSHQLDSYFHTTLFSTFVSQNEQKIGDLIEQKQKLLALFEHNIYFSLEMPGTVVEANTELRNQDALIWKVDAYRFLSHDYVLKAQSRTCNVWAFVATTLLLLVGVYCFRRCRYLRKRERK